MTENKGQEAQEEQEPEVEQPKDVAGELRFAADKVYFGAIKNAADAITSLQQVATIAKKAKCQSAFDYVAVLTRSVVVAFEFLTSGAPRSDAPKTATESPDPSA